MARKYYFMDHANVCEFFANADGGNRVHVCLPVNRANVYYIRRLIRRYTRNGYTVRAYLNHNGRGFANVWGSDMYAQTAKRADR